MYLDTQKVIENAAAKIADQWAHISLAEAQEIAALVMQEEEAEMVREGTIDSDITFPAQKDANGDLVAH